MNDTDKTAPHSLSIDSERSVVDVLELGEGTGRLLPDLLEVQQDHQSSAKVHTTTMSTTIEDPALDSAEKMTHDYFKDRDARGLVSKEREVQKAAVGRAMLCYP